MNTFAKILNGEKIALKVCVFLKLKRKEVKFGAIRIELKS